MITKYSPWGRIQSSKTIAEGIEFVSTAGHGGVKLDRKNNAKMPVVFRRKNGWYEEDCEAALVIITFPEHFKQEVVDAAHKSAKNWYPDEYEKHFGVVIPLAESITKSSRAFDAVKHDKFVVTSAWGDWNETVPKGMVGVLAYCAKTDESKYFLVTHEEYCRRSENGYRFVVDPTIHKEVEKFK